MATLLYRFGRFSARRHWLVLSVWALLVAVVAVLALALPRNAAPDTSFSIPGTEASEGLDVVGEKFSAAAADAATGTIVFQAPDGQTLTGENADALQTTLAQVRDIEGIAAVTDPLAQESLRVNQDQTIAASTVTFATAPGDVTDATRDDFDAVTDTDAGDVRVEVTSDLVEPGGAHAAEAIGVAVAFVVLLLTYGSLAAAGANLLTAGLGVGLGVLGITALGRLVSLSTTTPALAGMLGLAVGIDYALFIFARTRTELRAGASVPEAVAKATGTAGTAVVFAGATVIIALTGLAVVNIPFLTQMGLAAAATVFVAVLAALTAVPALLAVMGRWVLPKRERDLDDPGLVAAEAERERQQHTAGVSDEALSGPGFLGRWSRSVTRHPVIALLTAVIAVGAVALPVASMRTALPSAETADPASSSRQAYDLLVEGFGAGSQATLVVVVDGTGGATPEEVATAATTVVGQVQALDDVVAVTPPIPAADGSAQLITVVPGSGPTEQATTDLVNDIRDTVAGTADADVLVTGQTALNIDVSQALADALPVYIGLIVLLALVLLVLLFRSIAVPLLATVGFLLSLGASMGATVAIYQWGWLSDVFGVTQPAPLLSFMPVLVVGILFGLAMDYQMFLVSAIHEAHAKGHTPTHAVLTGFRRSGPVVVAAAFIMAGVFAGFAFSGEATIGTIGMALTVGVLVDALVVRMVIVPAALTLLGEAAWWMPRWMQRIVPNVDAEGHGLEKLLAAGAATTTTTTTTPPAPARPGSGAEDTLPTPRRADRSGSGATAAATDGAPADAAPAERGRGTGVDSRGVCSDAQVAAAAAELPLGIVGTVTDGAGHPLAGAALTVTDHTGRQLARTRTEADGLYRLPLAAGGTFVLIVAAHDTKPAARMVAVSDNAVRHDVRLAGTGRLSGQVLAGAATGVAGAVLTLLDVQGAVVATTRTEADGTYSFEALMGGSLVLSVLSEEFRPLAQTIDLPAGESLRLDVHLSAGGRLVGNVVAASDGRGLQEANVTLVDPDGMVVDTTTTNPDGSFSFGDLTGGRYTVTAAGFGPVATGVEVAEGSTQDVELTLGAAQENSRHRVR